MTPFEQKLAAAKRSEMPSEWRVRILPPPKRTPSLLPAFLLRLFSFPHPLAWAAIGLAWLGIAALNLSGPRGPELYAVTPAEYRDHMPDSEEYLVQYALQQRLIAALIRERREKPGDLLRRPDF